MAKRSNIPQSCRQFVRDIPELREFALVADSECVTLYGYGFYPRSSVLAGQSRDVQLAYFGNMDEAKAAHPDVPVDGYAGASTPMVPSCPPSDFDPADAGESWDED